MAIEEFTRFRAFDGLTLAGTVTRPERPIGSAAVLVHGGGVTRDEAGFFTRLAGGLAEAGVTVLRFDLRGHGESEGRQEDLTLCSVANDISAAVSHVRAAAGQITAVHLYGTSFSGGICTFWAARNPEVLGCLTLANPLLDYKKRFVDDKPYWHDNRIDDAEGQELTVQGSLPHSPTFRLGRALLNEVFYVEPRKALSELRVPTLFLHGTKDTFIPVESSRAAVTAMTSETRIIEIEGAQHGFAVHDDPAYQDPQTRTWQEFVISEVTKWMTEHA
jgi:pimeloyl-ACP methyl ester carboxylesterase